MSYVLIVRMKAQEGNEDRAAQLMAELAEASREEAGCEAYVPCRETEDARSFAIFERYRDRRPLRSTGRQITSSGSPSASSGPCSSRASGCSSRRSRDRCRASRSRCRTRERHVLVRVGRTRSP